MLSEILDIRHPRDLCAYLNRRAVAGPMGRINGILANYTGVDNMYIRARYRGTGMGTQRIRELTLELVASGGRVMQSKLFRFPLSRLGFVKEVCALDRYAENHVSAGRNGLGTGF